VEASELRLRCLEAAVKVPALGYQFPTQESALATAKAFFEFVSPPAEVERPKLGLPGKK